jgi:hypothetical protein
MAGGAIMISDMFDNALKARVDALCNELSALIQSKSDFAAADAFQSQRQGARGNPQLGSSSLSGSCRAGPSELVALGSWRSSSLGAQNEVRYAYFPATRRLANDINGRVTARTRRTVRLVGLAATARIRLPQFLEPARRC